MANNEDFLKRLKEIFKLEAIENIETILNELLRFEKVFNNLSDSEKNTESVIKEIIDINKDSIETILRQVHSLKGAARSVSLTDVVNICQSLESNFVALKKGKISLNEIFFEIIYQALNTIKAIVEDSEKKYLVYPLIKQLNDLQSKKKKLNNENTENSIELISDINQNNVEKIRAEEPLLEKENNNSQSALNEKQSIVEKIELLTTDKELKTESKTVPSKKNNVNETIRVEISKLDKLLNHAEDMLSIKLNSEQQNKDIEENRLLIEQYFSEQNKLYSEIKNLIRSNTNVSKFTFNKINEIMEGNYKKEKTINDKLNNLINQSEQNKDEINSKIDILLKQVKKTVMFPVSTILSHLPLMIRDLSKDINKKIEFTIEGDEIEIDKRILEEIKEPLIHLIRNSVDHGIELPENRNGKNPVGTIKISINQSDSNRVEIKVYDDGKGLNYPKIKNKVVELELLTIAEANSLSEHEIAQYIFHSGLSTSSIITEISGRGLGLAIVKDKIERIGGTINVVSETGKCTAFIINLPLTIATFKGLLVKTSEKLFVIPLNVVEKTIRIAFKDINSIEGKTTVNVDGEILSCFYLSDILKINYSQSQKSQKYLQIVIIALLGKKLAIWVDEILYEQEVMVKTLGKQLSRVLNIAGLTLLGSGQNVPLLNFRDIFKYVKNERMIESYYIEETSKKVKNKILVAEDSITSRTLIKNMLESAGYDVKTVIDGMEAYSVLETESFDLLVSDVEMPRMSGFELTAKVRANKKLFELPVILITSLNSREHKEKGIEVGANAYIVKNELEQDYLLNIIPRLL